MSNRKAAAKKARQPLLKLAGSATNLDRDHLARLLYLQFSAARPKEELRARGIGIPATKADMCERLAAHFAVPARYFTLTLS